jgi:heat shock protein HslJ
LGCSAGQTSGGKLAADPATTPDSPVGATWEWVRTVTPVERFEAVDPTRYTLTLNADGTVAARFDCNRGRGEYTLSEHRIEFGPLATTRMACPPDTQDHIFARQLDTMRSFFMRDGELFLEAPYDSGTMRFRAAEQAD